MKKLLFLTASLFILNSFARAQEIKYSELPTVTKRGKYTSYIAKDGFEYKVGDKVKIGFPSSNKTFAFIKEGDLLMIDLTPITVDVSGKEVEIKSIWTGGSKKTGFTVGLITKGMGIGNYIIDIENAVESKELKSSVMSSDEALNALKKAKDKLDLGLITQAEYDKLKAELALIIK